MVITIVCDVLGAENNGTTIAAMNLIRSLKNSGHEVRIICPDADKAALPGYYVVPTYNLGLLNGYVARNGVSLAKPSRSVLERALDGADAVHIMTPFALGIAAVRMARQKGLPLTAGFHCQAENFTNHIFLMNLGLANWITYKIFYHKLYQYCDAIHYPSAFICDTFEHVVGPTNHYVISNGVNRMFRPGTAEKPEALRDRFVILFTGRYSREKSHRVLIDAIARSAYRDKIQLIFAGAGPRRKTLERRVRRRGITPPIMQFYSRTDLLHVLHYTDLYVHPAEIEIEAIACLEAIACGNVPVISNSRRSATRYFALSDRNLFRCNDSADLARQIDYWITHPDERQKCSESYLGYAEQFDFDTCMQRMEQMICDTAVRKRTSQGKEV